MWLKEACRYVAEGFSRVLSSNFDTFISKLSFSNFWNDKGYTFLEKIENTGRLTCFMDNPLRFPVEQLK